MEEIEVFIYVTLLSFFHKEILKFLLFLFDNQGLSTDHVRAIIICALCTLCRLHSMVLAHLTAGKNAFLKNDPLLL